MGRIVKGARASEQRYTVAVPAISTSAESVPDAFADGFDPDPSGFAFEASVVPELAPHEPAVDMEAVHAQAVALIDEATANADVLLADAHERARAMIDEAAARADAIAEEARSAAHDAGYAAGRESADREMGEMLDSMRRLFEMARLERHALITSAEPELVRLAMGIAERVLHQQVALDRGVVVEMAKAAISRLVDREQITVRVNPADLERMREHREDVLALGDVRTMRIIEDQRVDRGGVVVETDGGTIDAKISTQLHEARKVLHIDDDLVVHPAATQEIVHGTSSGAARAS